MRWASDQVDGVGWLISSTDPRTWCDSLEIGILTRSVDPVTVRPGAEIRRPRRLIAAGGDGSNSGQSPAPPVP